jgi:hypothetical protein
LQWTAFNCPRALPPEVDIIFQYSPWFTVLCLLLGAGYALGMYLRDRQTAELPKWTVRGLAALRAIAVFIIALLLLGPLLRTTQKRTEKPIIIIAQDNSSSVTLNADSNFYRTAYLEQADRMAAELSKKFDVQRFTFGANVAEGAEVSFQEGRTDYSQLFAELDNRFANRNVGAIILASDGIFNRGSDPVYSPLRLTAPVYAIALGDTSVKKDIVLSKVDHNRYAYLGNEYPVEMTVEAEQFKGQTVLVQIAGDKGVLWEERVSIAATTFRKTLSARVKADTPGLNRLRVSVESLKGELSRANNTQDVFIEVLDGRQQVLILAAAPHPDIAALRRSIASNQNYGVEAIIAGQGEVVPEKYDLIILHQLPYQSGEGRAELTRIMAADVPLLAIIGGATDLSAFNALNLGLRVNAGRRAQNQVQPVMARGFSVFAADGELRRMLNRFPPLNVPFGEFSASGSAQPMLLQRIGNVETEHPLLLFNDLSGRKVGVLAGEGVWRWRMKDFQDNGSHAVFDGLMSKVVQYLAVKTDKSLFRVSTRNRYTEDEQVIFGCSLYDDTYEPVNGPDVSLSIRDEAGKEYTYTFGRTETAYRLNVGSFKAGSYSYTASVSHGGKVHEAKGRFMVAALTLESVNTTADHGLLHRLAAQSGGAVVSAKELQRLTELIASREDVRNVIYEQTWFKEAIHLRWLFALILLLLAVEWFVRKRSGTY